jgi:hypothetical protein
LKVKPKRNRKFYKEELQEQLTNGEEMIQLENPNFSEKEKNIKNNLYKKVEKELNHEILSTEFEKVNTNEGHSLLEERKSI